MFYKMGVHKEKIQLNMSELLIKNTSTYNTIFFNMAKWQNFTPGLYNDTVPLASQTLSGVNSDTVECQL